ncbi:FAD-dependent oxidoreductase [Synechococcus sp. BA-124 BA4]|uniref:NAD(P)/FAD-dependent oxidoreductase n=1 Tax=unclassified Synechococcus TaxID=2626047 RepID=UPI0018CF89D0|nr:MULTISPECIES: FAD-dependent oxidoreductase [unclassified Synechococcus]MEA5399844.1 FAD-dependent oxidoreductase [Synechococcus sp. BA-124 BA4]QPN56681.1 FAD-dependent oxidoreductase [Synechococcus sp. CBW1107]
MLRLSELRLPLDHTDDELRQAVLKRLGLPARSLRALKLVRRSVDARNKDAIRFSYSLDLEVDDPKALLQRWRKDPHLRPAPDTTYRFVAQLMPGELQRPERPIVIGAGPCGYFAALVLAQMGLRPLLLERGKPIKERTSDTFGFWRGQRPFDPESNVQFGEGGAGTFSDGKLYSQVRDPRHLGRKVLEELVACGANPEILTLHHPHIGTFKLATVVRGLRSRIEALGGEIRFRSEVVRLEIEADPGGRRVCGVELADGSCLQARHVVLAVGHSARDTFASLHRDGVLLEPKPFSIGVRLEHPQSLIDSARWGPCAGHPRLGAAEYKLVHHLDDGRSVYSFCMCPGGLVVAAASEPGHLVTNGMSQHSRNERNANSGIVVGLELEDLLPYGRGQGDPLAGVAFQRHWEAKAFALGGGSYRAPVQRLDDFLAGRGRSRPPGSIQPSYAPGTTPADLSACLPDFAVAALREAIPAFERSIPGYAMGEALLTGVETRTSSPVRIPRGPDLQSLNTRGLYPAGEGAGYAGGILSAGIDGIRVAEAVASSLLRTGPQCRSTAPP